MKTRHFYDKHSWLKGPWHEEPDYLAWLDKEYGYACVARRNLTGAWCGYVGLDAQHPLFMVSSTEKIMDFIEVHGTVSYTEWNAIEDTEFYPTQRRWWIGFDAMQDTDFCPALRYDVKPKKRKKPIYRDLQYIITQIEHLAKQLALFDSRFSLP